MSLDLNTFESNNPYRIATIGAGALLIEEDKVLLVQPSYGKAKNQWILPGGFVESNESLEEAVLRELKEETGIDGEIIAPLCSRHRSEPLDNYWVFKVKKVSGEIIPDPTKEIINAKFWSIEKALSDSSIRPMTRFFIAGGMDKKSVQIPNEYSSKNKAYFF